MTKKEHRMYVIFDILINKIGKQNFTVEEKDLINYYSKGYFFDNDEDLKDMRAVRKALDDLKREREFEEKYENL